MQIVVVVDDREQQQEQLQQKQVMFVHVYQLKLQQHLCKQHQSLEHHLQQLSHSQFVEHLQDDRTRSSSSISISAC